MASLRSGRQIGADGEFIGLNETERYLGNPVANGYILLANTDGTRSWVDPDSVFIAGETDLVIVKQEGTNVGTGGTNSTLDFYGNFAITQSPVGIASIRLADTLNIGGLNVTGVSTFTRTDRIQISVGHIDEGPDTTDGGIKLVGIGTTAPISSGLFTEVDGEILSYGINVGQISTTGYSTDRVGGIFRLDTRTSGSFGDSSNFVVKGRSIGTTVEHDSVVINLDTGETSLSPDKGNVGIGTISASELLDVNGDARFRGAIYDNNNVVGSANSVLVSTGSGVVWKSPETISTGIATDSDLLDGLDSTQFVRSDVFDRKTSGSLRFNDSVQAQFGTDGELQIYHNGTDSFIDQTGTGVLYIRNLVDDADVVIQSDNGSGNTTAYLRADGSTGQVRLYQYGVEKFQTTADGVYVTPNVGLGTTAGNADASQDLAVFQTKTSLPNSGNTSYLKITEKRDVDGTDWTTAHTRIQKTIDSTDMGYIQFNGDGNTYGMEFGTQGDEKFAQFIRNGAVELYYDNSKKFETTSNGISVLNNVGIGTNLASQSLDVNGNARFRGAIYDNNNVVGTANSVLVSTGSGVVWKSPGLAVGVASDADLLDGLDSTQFLRSDVADTKVGVTTFQDDIFLGDDDILKFGNSEDLQIYHSSNINRIEASQQLYVKGTSINLYKAGSSELMASFVQDGAVELYYDNSKKFETTTTGIAVSNGASTSATIAGPDEIIIDPATVGDNTGSVRIKGDLFVDGTQTQINSTTIELADFIVGIATTATTDTLADGAGIQIGPDNTFLYEYNSGTNPSLKSSENLNVATGKVYQINQTEILSVDTLSLGTGTTIHSPASNVLTFGTNGTEKVRITSDGNFGIGTDNPNRKLVVENSGDTFLSVKAGTSDDVGVIFGDTDSDARGLIRYANNGDSLRFWTSGSEKVRITSDGNLGIGTISPGYKLEVNGSFAATTKSFVIDHPTKEGMKLRYGSLEGPENGVYVRGRLNGNNTIELPDYWTGLVDEETITVNLTPIGRNASLHSVIDIVDNTVVVESASGEVNCFYTVFGERKDTERFEVEF